MSEETDGQIELAPDALPGDPVDADEVAAAVAAVAKDAAATAADAKSAEEAAIEAAVGEEASVLISEAAAGMICFSVFMSKERLTPSCDVGLCTQRLAPLTLSPPHSPTTNTSRCCCCCRSISRRSVCRGR